MAVNRLGRGCGIVDIIFNRDGDPRLTTIVLGRSSARWFFEEKFKL
jgi:hypothetical protein